MMDNKLVDFPEVVFDPVPIAFGLAPTFSPIGPGDFLQYPKFSPIGPGDFPTFSPIGFGPAPTFSPIGPADILEYPKFSPIGPITLSLPL